MAMNNCFAYSTKGTSHFCFALSEILCDDKECPFFKTKEQLEADEEMVIKRLTSIGILTDVIKKYHKQNWIERRQVDEKTN